MKVFYFCPDVPVPAGGVKQIYRHVDILNKAGITARVVHKHFGFRCKWFDNQTSLAYLEKGFIAQCYRGFQKVLSRQKPFVNQFAPGYRLKEDVSDLSSQTMVISKEDFVVIPEIFAGSLAGRICGLKKIIFNQGAYLTFRKEFCDDIQAMMYFEQDTHGIITVSEDSKGYLEYAFPKTNIYRLCNGIKDEVFCYSSQKKRQICYMANKKTRDIEQVISLLKARKMLDGWRIVPISGCSEREVADIFKDSIIFLSSACQEGFGLPAVEAAVCGCLLVGYSGMGGNEYFLPDFTYCTPQDDIIAFAKALERTIGFWEGSPHKLLDKGKRASEFMLSRYSLEREQIELLAIWDKIQKCS